MRARLIAAGLVVAIVASARAGELELVRGGKPVATIVVSDSAPAPERFAAAELQALLERATGARLAIAAKAPQGAQGVVVVGQAAVREAGEQFLKAAQLDQLRDDGYATVVTSQPPALILAGKEPRGTLYAVYRLLESELACGFFSDGDNVPKRADVVLAPISVAANPAFARRACYVPLGLYGPKRFQATLWNAEDWRAFLRWMAKKQLNCLAIPFTASSRAWGAAFDQAFPEAKARRQEAQAGEGPAAARMGWGLAPEHTTAVLKDAFEYARKTLGLEVTYIFIFGEFEDALRRAMPGLKWKPPYPPDYPAAAGGSCALAADEPKCRELQARLWKAIIETYGTDHSYVVCSQGPPIPVGAPQQAENTAAVAVATLRQVDPAGKAALATWSAELWGATPPDKAAFLRALPEGTEVLYWHTDLGALRRMPDAATPTDPTGGGWVHFADVLYTATERFADRPFQYARTWGAAGNDLLENRFGLLANCFHHFRHFSPQPKAVGFWNWHELKRTNPMMDDLSAEFAWTGAFVWRGEGATTNRVVNRYLERRYGAPAIFAMAEAHKQALRGAPNASPGVNYRAYARWADIPAPGSSVARTAVALALACKPAAGASPFYEADLVDMARNYLHQYIQEHCNQALGIARDAKRAAAAKSYGEAEKADARARLDRLGTRLLAAHKTLLRLLATRKDMCLDDAIIEAAATKGANRLLAQAIREHQSALFAGGYALTDSIEYHQQVAAGQLQHLLDYARREASNPTPDPVPGWEAFFRHGADAFAAKSEPAPYDKKVEKTPASDIIQQFLEGAE